MKHLCLLLLCLGGPLALAQSGSLSVEDDQTEYGTYYDLYRYDGAQGETLTVTITSSEIDPYLLVLGPDNQVVWEKDDSEGQGFNVHETITLGTAGQYLIVVTSASAGETGLYELSVQSATGNAGDQSQEASTPPASQPEPNVVQGRVTDQQGDPVAAATVTISGYTGNGANVVEHAQTDANGYYRHAVPAGLYNVDAEAVMDYQGETFHLYLQPADGSCEELYSEAGIIKDFTLKLTGLQTCLNSADPTNYNNYSGGTLYLNHAFPRNLPADAQLTILLTPTRPLLDGSQGEVLRFTRSAAAADSGYGATLERTMYLHDIPIGTYRVSGHVLLPDGTQQPLRFGPYLAYEPADTYDIGFEAVRMWPYGIRVTSIDVFDPSWSGQ